MKTSVFFHNKGQNTLEYAIILGLVVSALGLMNTYVRRGIQAAIKISADEMGQQEDAAEDPEKGGLTWSTKNTREVNRRRERVITGGSQITDLDKTSTGSGQTEYITFEDASGEGL